MEKQFVPYELAVKLKELGFKEECFKWWGSDGILNQKYNLSNTILAPIWQQAFDWFRNEYKFKIGIGINDKGLYYDYKIVMFNTTDTYYKDCYNTYSEARLACLEKLIELCKK